MGAATTDIGASAVRGAVEVRREGDGVLRVRLAGAWRLVDGLPSLEPVRRALEGGAPRQVVLDAADVGAWDSAATTFLTGVDVLCRERGIPVDRAGLPAGMTRLLALAEAVPEKTDAKRDGGQEPWLARFGRAAMAWGEATTNVVEFVGEVSIAFARLVSGRARFRWSEVFFEMQKCGARALGIVTLISFLVGMILAFVGAVQLRQFGASIYVANLVAIAMAREMGAMMTAIIMAGRTGSGFAAELGTMKVTQEMDALGTMGVPPVDYLVLPRLMALGIMMPLLCVYSDFIGMVGGAVVAISMLHLNVTQYALQTQDAITLTFFATGIGKSVVFGALIAIAGCYQGMRCGKNASAVGDAATAAVVSSIVAIVVTDGVFAVLFEILGI